MPMTPTTMKLTTLDTADGPFTLLVDTGEVLAAGWTADPDAILARLRPEHRPADVAVVAPDDPEVADAAAAVAAYYAGDLAAIDSVRVRQFGSAWRLRGWQRLRAIPPGSPLTYAAFAGELGNPSGVRAAAGICASNAPALFVPCHRVQRADGSLGGFAWGVAIKRSLLIGRLRGDAPVTGDAAREPIPGQDLRTSSTKVAPRSTRTRARARPRGRVRGSGRGQRVVGAGYLLEPRAREAGVPQRTEDFCGRPERVDRALHHQHRSGDTSQLGDAGLRGLARWVQRERQRDDARPGRAPKPRQAVRAPALRPPANSGRSGHSRRTAASAASSRDRGRPVEPGSFRPATRCGCR